MDLDDLKAKWQQEAADNLQSNKKDMEQLQFILKQKTRDTLSGLKKKYERIISFVLIGVFLNILISPFLHFLLGDEGPVFRLTLSGLLSLITVIIACLIVVFFYWIKYKSLNTDISNDDLKLILKGHIQRLKRSLKQEIVFIVALFVCLFISGRMASQYLGNGNFGDIFRKDILIAMLAGFLIMGFYIYKRLKVYRKDISELQKYLSEFNEEA